MKGHLDPIPRWSSAQWRPGSSRGDQGMDRSFTNPIFSVRPTSGNYRGKSVGGAQPRGTNRPGIVGELTAAALYRAGISGNRGLNQVGSGLLSQMRHESCTKAAVVAESHTGNLAHYSSGQNCKARAG